MPLFQQKHFNLLIIQNAIGKIRTSKVAFDGNPFDILILPMASEKIRMLKLLSVWFLMFWLPFWYSDCLFDVLIFLILDALIVLIFFWMLRPFDVMIFDVSTPSQINSYKLFAVLVHTKAAYVASCLNIVYNTSWPTWCCQGRSINIMFDNCY
jgi:hypothetical protein